MNWSSAEVANFRRMRKRGDSLQVIAKLLGYPLPAVRELAQNLEQKANKDAREAAQRRAAENDNEAGWTKERVARLRQMWGAGASGNEIASALGITRNAVLGKLHRLTIPTGKNSRTKLTDAQVEERLAKLKSMADAGEGISDAARLFEISPSAIHNFLRNRNPKVLRELASNGQVNKTTPLGSAAHARRRKAA